MPENFLAIMILYVVGINIALIVFYATRVRRVSANEALIVSGRGDQVTKRPYRVVIGPGRSFIWPVIERVDYLSLEMLRHDFAISEVQTSDGKTVTVKGTIQVKVKAEIETIVNAVRHFLTKSESDIQLIVADLLEEQIRSQLLSLPKSEILPATAIVAEKMKTAVQPNLEEIGMECVALILKHAK